MKTKINKYPSLSFEVVKKAHVFLLGMKEKLC